MKLNQTGSVKRPVTTVMLDRRAPLGEPTVDEALAMASLEDENGQTPTRAAKCTKTQAIETAAAAATKAKAKEEATSGRKGEKAVKSARNASKVKKVTVMTTAHEESVRSLRTSYLNNADDSAVVLTVAVVSKTPVD
ncbi:hypothetical protein MTO96_007272 [Rhipicephalus appendiculatus]